MTLAEAITQLEGTNPAYNNPGAISGTGNTGTSFGAGIGIYSSLAAGQTALQNQLSTIASGGSSYYDPNMSLSDFGTTYSGGNTSYGSNLATLMGVSPSTPVGQVINSGSSSGDSMWNYLNPTYTGQQLAQGIAGTALGQKLGLSAGSQPISLENWAVIIVGLILIAAGLFSFRQTQSVINLGGRIAKRGTELAAS